MSTLERYYADQQRLARWAAALDDSRQSERLRQRLWPTQRSGWNFDKGTRALIDSEFGDALRSYAGQGAREWLAYYFAKEAADADNTQAARAEETAKWRAYEAASASSVAVGMLINWGKRAIDLYKQNPLVFGATPLDHLSFTSALFSTVECYYMMTCKKLQPSVGVLNTFLRGNLLPDLRDVDELNDIDAAIKGLTKVLGTFKSRTRMSDAVIADNLNAFHTAVMAFDTVARASVGLSPVSEVGRAAWDEVLHNKVNSLVIKKEYLPRAAKRRRLVDAWAYMDTSTV